MTSELKNGQIVGIVKREAFPGCPLDITVNMVQDDGTSLKIIQLQKNGVNIPRSAERVAGGIQYTFPELAPVLCPETNVKKVL